jgi:DNA polymerase-3 subunit delta
MMNLRWVRLGRFRDVTASEQGSQQVSLEVGEVVVVIGHPATPRGGGVGGTWEHQQVPPKKRPAGPASLTPEQDVAGATAVLVFGAEDYLADRVVSTIVATARAADPMIDRRDVDLASEQALGALVESLSPNLFGDAAVVVCRGAESADGPVVDALIAAVDEGLSEGTRLVVVHPGGVKGRGVADRLKKAGLVVAACDKPKGRAVDDFITMEFHRRDRRISPDAVGALRVALGDDLRSLGAACSQLCSDVEGDPIDANGVADYYDGVADVPGYLISDAVWDGRAVEVLRRTRWALLNDPGIGPAVTSAVASGLRQLAKYSGAPRGLSEGELASLVGAPPFKLRALREQSGQWNGVDLARAFGELAVTDAAVKGRDASGRVLEQTGLDREQGTYALEQALLAIVARRR